MSMPETSVDEQNGAPGGEDEVWPAWQFRFVQAITEAGRVKCAADHKLRRGVLSADTGHVELALLGRQRIDTAG
jgi:hypothetical protein